MAKPTYELRPTSSSELLSWFMKKLAHRLEIEKEVSEYLLRFESGDQPYKKTSCGGESGPKETAVPRAVGMSVN